MRELEIDTEKTLSFLVDFLAGAIRNAGFERAVVGLSGGVDSSLSCTLATRALGPENVNALFMPYATSHDDSRRHAFMIAGQLGVGIEEVDITPQIDLYYRSYPDEDPVRRGNKMRPSRVHSAEFEPLL